MHKFTDEELYNQAKKRVFLKKSFNFHLIIYILSSILLFIISNSNKSKWFIFPIAGWGLIVLIHKISLSIFLNSSKSIEKEFISLKEKLK